MLVSQSVSQLEARCKVVDKITFGSLAKELRSPESTIKYLWTPFELDLLNEYIPSTHHRVTQDLGIDPGPETDKRKSRLAFQIQSELVNKSSTLDAAIIHGRRDEGTVESKLYGLNRHRKLLDILAFDG